MCEGECVPYALPHEWKFPARAETRKVLGGFFLCVSQSDGLAHAQTVTKPTAPDLLRQPAALPRFFTLRPSQPGWELYANRNGMQFVFVVGQGGPISGLERRDKPVFHKPALQAIKHL